jgi:antibiotic biosynthesis monooxygenase (ABM) superfamily enzyme
MNQEVSDMTSTTESRPTKIPPPSKHQLALMIWICVFPTLTLLNVAFADWLGDLSPVLRTFVLATIAVPIVIYGLMPHLHRLRVRLLTLSRVS